MNAPSAVTSSAGPASPMGSGAGVPPGRPDAAIPGGSGGKRRRNALIGAGSFIVVLALAAGAFLIFGGGGTAQALTVTLQPIGDAGPGPFTASVVNVETPAAKKFASKYTRKLGTGPGEKNAGSSSSKPSSEPPSTPMAGGGFAPVSYQGDTSGLYGVDPSEAVCDTSRLTGLITKNDAKAKAWAATMGVNASTIPATIKGFTPVLLGADTAVTNHSYGSNGARAFQGILEAGTAVLIDAHGTPRVQCVSGNPLAKPDVPNGPVQIEGDRWDGYDSASVVQVTPTPDPVQTIEGIGIHNGDPVTVGVGDSVSLDGYLVSDVTGVSVVSLAGKETTKIVDHQVGRAFGDGMGGIVYEDSIRADPSSSIDGAHSIMWLRAGKPDPMQLVEVHAPDVTLRALGTGRFNGADVLFYARQDNSSTDGVYNQGAGSELIVRDLRSGREHQVVAPDGGSIKPEFLSFAAALASRGAVGKHHLIFQETQGTVPALFEVNENYQVSDLDAGVCNLQSLDFRGCGADVVAPFPADQVDFITTFYTDSQVISYLTRADLSTSSIVSRTPLNDLPDFRCDGGERFMNGNATGTVVSFGPGGNGWPDCKASIIDRTTHKVTELPFGGFVVPLNSPVIRPAITTGETPPSTFAPTTAAPAPTAPPTTASTTLPPAPSMDLQQIAAGNYTSLIGTWNEEAMAVNPHDGTGTQWRPGGSDTLAITSNSITLNDNLKIQGNTLRFDKGGGPEAFPLSFQDNGGYLDVFLADQMVAINYSLTFYPKGAVDLNDKLQPNNGVTLDNSKDAIYIWSSNNGYTTVFSRAG